MNYMNEKRKILDNIIDLGWSQEEISKKVSEIDKYTSKTPYPMEVGKSFSEASWYLLILIKGSSPPWIPCQIIGITRSTSPQKKTTKWLRFT